MTEPEFTDITSEVDELLTETTDKITCAQCGKELKTRDQPHATVIFELTHAEPQAAGRRILMGQFCSLGHLYLWLGGG